MNDAADLLQQVPLWLRFDFTSASWIVAVISLTLCSLYLAGAFKLWSQRRFWNPARLLSFVLGCVIAFLVTTLGVNAAAPHSLTALMFQQITLLTVVPPLLLTGAPGVLLLRTMPHGGFGGTILRAALGGLRSKWTGMLLHPAVPIIFALLAFPVLYLSDAISIFVSTRAGMEFLLVMFLLGGILAAVPLWSVDPLPRAQSFPSRFLDIAIELQIHAILGLTFLRMGRPIFEQYSMATNGIDPVYDQAVAGALLWTYAEMPLFLVLIICLARWFAQEQKSHKINQSSEDAAMDSYNEYLLDLSDQDRMHKQH
ncbi:cytochrome c oxidase assembly protein [Brevibacterium spongiae]|uniref:Cytochrome c oxidase assembly protein n=1 Tax=Brevibacterium spongiae TaxID=2909672 RepID=A0ABY5SK91_9MICO|nr:cytochrome c oxidase assembly protein [Brevibacterium spongiae]UVI34376.1 cytochrome c oxidase assembly protein [Brevibacterium spongiae]